MSRWMTEEQVAAHQARVKPVTVRELAEAFEKPAKPSKYRNVKTVVDGVKFDSKREAAQDAELVLREKAGEISNLVRQVKFPLVVDGVKLCTYIADWTYTENGKYIVRDCKGIKTPLYRLKKKLMKAIWKLEITES